MSLRNMLAQDRRYVAERYEEPQGYQTVQDAAEDVVRMKIAPLLCSLHFRGDLRDANQIQLDICFRDADKYTIVPKAQWVNGKNDKGIKGMPFIQTHYNAYLQPLNKEELWKEVLRRAESEEWQIDGQIDTEKGKAFLIFDMT